MKSLIIDGYTRLMAKDQDEYSNLAIKDVSVELPIGVNGSTASVNCMFSCWEPTEEERKLLIEGGHVVLGILGTQFPPVIMSVSNEVAQDCGQDSEKDSEKPIDNN